HGPVISQGEVIGILNEFTGPRDVVVNAAGSMPGDLHKLWRARDPKQYHLEYGYSCMGYEIAAGLGIKMAAPDRDVYVLVGDGSYLMMAQGFVTACEETGSWTFSSLTIMGSRASAGCRRRSDVKATRPSIAIATIGPGCSMAPCCPSISHTTERASARSPPARAH